MILSKKSDDRYRSTARVGKVVNYQTKIRSAPSSISGRNLLPGLGVFIAVVAVVMATPFLGWLIAAQEHPTNRVSAGAPSANLAAQLHERAAAIMPSSEEILFVASPEPGHEGMAKIWFVPFSIAWTIFSLCWTLAAGSAAGRGRSPLGWLFVLWGLPFIAIGVGMLVTPYFSYKRDLHTVYAISENRALAFTNEKVREIVDFHDKEFGPIELRPYSENRADLLFRYSYDSESPGLYDGFWGIEKSDQAWAILNKKWRQKVAAH